MKKTRAWLAMIPVLCIFLSFQLVFAQNEAEQYEETQVQKKAKKRIGLSASIQGNDMDIVVPYWIQRKLVIGPTFGINYIQSQSTEIRIGMVLRCFKKLKRLSPYYGLRGGIVSLTQENGSDAVDSYLGLLLGGEFFFTAQFSIGVETQLNMFKSSANSYRFNNPDGVNVMTSTVIIANIYF